MLPIAESTWEGIIDVYPIRGSVERPNEGDKELGSGGGGGGMFADWVFRRFTYFWWGGWLVGGSIGGGWMSWLIGAGGTILGSGGRVSE